MWITLIITFQKCCISTQNNSKLHEVAYRLNDLEIINVTFHEDNIYVPADNGVLWNGLDVRR
jgi:hypothetical protein